MQVIATSDEMMKADPVSSFRRDRASPFEINGLVSARRVYNSQWRNAYGQLEAFSKEFLALFPHWGRGYPWPPDPLRCWFRPFEYPYVLHNLPTLEDGRSRVVADIGSAVTFFPLLLSQQGYLLKCVDSDPRMKEFWRRLKACIPGKWAECASRIEYGISGEFVLPFGTEEVDAVTCISVLEHVSDPPRLMREILRILKPGGVLILTMDISLESNQGISAEYLNEICNLLEADCAPAHPIELVHPQELLVFPGSPRGLVPAPWDPPRSLSDRVVGRLEWRYECLRKGRPSPRSLCLFVGTYLKGGALVR